MQNPKENQAESLQVSYPKTLGEILDALPSEDNLGSISKTNGARSSITTSPRGKHAPIGKPLSEHGLGMLRNLAQSVNSGSLLDDRKLRELLTQHFGSRLAIRDKVRHVYGEQGQYDAVSEGHDIELDGLDDSELKLMDAIEFFNRPANPEFISGQIARLRVSMPRRAEENTDIELLIDVMVDDCRGYPADVIEHVCRQWRLENRFFPTPREFRAKLDRAVAFRKALLKAFTDTRNPLLAHRSEETRLEADERLEIAWRDLAKKDWLPKHYEWAIAECERMLKLAESNSTVMDAAFWKAKVASLKADETSSRSNAA